MLPRPRFVTVSQGDPAWIQKSWFRADDLVSLGTWSLVFVLSQNFWLKIWLAVVSTSDIVLPRLPRIPLHKLLLGNSHTTKPGVVDQESPHSVDIFLC
jgi:hypothetical protein